VKPCTQDQRGLMEYLWTPEIDVSPVRFGPGSQGITNGYLLVCNLQEWSSKGSKMQSSLATKDVVKSEV